MTFNWPLLLVGLLAVPMLGLLYASQRRRAKELFASYARFGEFTGAPSEPHAVGRAPAWTLLLLGLSLLTVGMARPQANVQVPRVEGTVILAFDVSGSMAADDLKPTRMEAAKVAARQFVAAQPAGVRIGVVSFSDSGFTVAAPTYDRDVVLAAIGRLSPQRGTSLANGILVSLNTIEDARHPDQGYYSALTPSPTAVPTPVPSGTYSSASIVLLSDGENTVNPDPLRAAQTAADRGVRVYTIGLGSPSGADLKVEGITVRTRLDEQALKQLAQISGGKYFNAPNEKDLNTIFEELRPELVVREEPTELTAVFAGVGMVLLLAGAVVSTLRSGRVA